MEIRLFGKSINIELSRAKGQEPGQLTFANNFIRPENPNHKYIRRYLGKNGKYIYEYQDENKQTYHTDEDGKRMKGVKIHNTGVGNIGRPTREDTMPIKDDNQVSLF